MKSNSAVSEHKSLFGKGKSFMGSLRNLLSMYYAKRDGGYLGLHWLDHTVQMGKSNLGMYQVVVP